MEATYQLPPRRIETELSATCMWCNRPLYTERWTEERAAPSSATGFFAMGVTRNERHFDESCIPAAIGQPFVMRCGQCWATKTRRPLWLKRLYRFFMRFNQD